MPCFEGKERGVSQREGPFPSMCARTKEPGVGERKKIQHIRGKKSCNASVFGGGGGERGIQTGEATSRLTLNWHDRVFVRANEDGRELHSYATINKAGARLLLTKKKTNKTNKTPHPHPEPQKATCQTAHLGRRVRESHRPKQHLTDLWEPIEKKK